MMFTKSLEKQVDQCFELKLEDRIIKINFRQSTRTNKIIIRDIYPKGYEVVYPNYCNIDKARDFFIKHYEWVCFHAKRKPTTSSFENESTLNLLGEELTILYTQNPRGLITIENNKLIIPGNPENSKTKIKNFLKSYLLTNLKEEANNFAKQIGKTFNKIGIADFKSKWGSCSIDASLAFNLKLVFAPKAVLIYVVAHEVAHLREMNHSKKFWDLVKQLQPGFEVHRRWLQNNNHLLKKYII